MKNRLIVTIIALFGLCGCAVHYYEIRPGTVTVYLRKPDAKIVYFASSANRFRPIPAVKINDKTWASQVNTEAEFRYFYIVDGHAWIPDCPLKENDEFGAKNCVFVPDM